MTPGGAARIRLPALLSRHRENPARRWDSVQRIVTLLPFYAIGVLITYGLKSFYRRAGADDLNWILAPVAFLVELLSGIPFERESRAGWISHATRTIVGPSCAGLNFLIVVFSTLFFSFVHRIGDWVRRGAWLGACAGIAYLLAVTTNALRVIAGILLSNLNLDAGRLAPERIHRAEGAIVYSLSLLLAYLAVEQIFNRFEGPRSGPRTLRVLVPLGWYLGIVLGVPLVTRAYRNDGARFLEHSALVLSVCVVLALSSISIRSALRAHAGAREGGAARMKPPGRGAKIAASAGSGQRAGEL